MTNALKLLLKKPPLMPKQLCCTYTKCDADDDAAATGQISRTSSARSRKSLASGENLQEGQRHLVVLHLSVKGILSSYSFLFLDTPVL
jgi:hypothetical protein